MFLDLVLNPFLLSDIGTFERVDECGGNTFMTGEPVGEVGVGS